MIIPFKKLVYHPSAVMEVNNLLLTGMVGLGSKVFEFEKELAEYTGFKYAVALDSCTSALFLSLKWWDKNHPFTLVSIPSMTVPLVADALYEVGMLFEFDDRTDWVGSSYNILGTNVWDSAHELDRGFRKFFPEDAVVCLSFYPTKSIGSADGGAILTDDKEMADWARQISTYGRNQTQKYGNSWDYEVTMKGYKRHYTNLQAVLCLSQLRNLDEMNADRKRIVDRYNDAFGLDNTSLYLYRIDVKYRDKFIDDMKELGIECGVHFKPLHLMQAFRDIDFRDDSDVCSVEEKYKHTVSLPLFDTMTKEEVDYVIEKVKPYVQK